MFHTEYFFPKLRHFFLLPKKDRGDVPLPLTKNAIIVIKHLFFFSIFLLLFILYLFVWEKSLRLIIKIRHLKIVI